MIKDKRKEKEQLLRYLINMCAGVAASFQMYLALFGEMLSFKHIVCAIICNLFVAIVNIALARADNNSGEYGILMLLAYTILMALLAFAPIYIWRDSWEVAFALWLLLPVFVDYANQKAVRKKK